MKKNPNIRGFTIIETLIAVLVIGIITIAAVLLIVDYRRVSDVAAMQLYLQSEGRNITEQLVADLRKATQSSTGSYVIDSATSTSLVFYSNINNDSYLEKVGYSIDGVNLQKSVIVPSGNPLAYNSADEAVTILSKHEANGATPLFQYYDNTYDGVSGSPLNTPVDITRIRLVKINLILDDGVLPNSAPFIIETKVNLRNLSN